MKPSVTILGIQIDALDLGEALKRSQAAMASGPCRYIVLPYVEFLVRVQQDPAIKSALDEAWLRLPNGVALGWAANFLEGPSHSFWRVVKTGLGLIFKPDSAWRRLPNRFDSSNFTRPLLQFAAKQHLKVVVIGRPKGGQIDDTVKALKSQLPDLDVSGFDGYEANDYGQVRAFLDQARADLVLVGMGFPRQELLMQRLSRELDHGVLIGEGGSFDYDQFGGQIKRAPKWWQAHGLEWLWRLLKEPTRLRRQLAVPKFVWRVYRSAH